MPRPTDGRVTSLRDMLKAPPPGALFTAARLGADAEREALSAGADQAEAKRRGYATAAAELYRAADEDIDPDPELAYLHEVFLRERADELAALATPKER